MTYLFLCKMWPNNKKVCSAHKSIKFEMPVLCSTKSKFVFRPILSSTTILYHIDVDSFYLFQLLGFVSWTGEVGSTKDRRWGWIQPTRSSWFSMLTLNNLLLLLLTTPISRKRAASRLYKTKKESKQSKRWREEGKHVARAVVQFKQFFLMCLAKELGAGTHAGASTTGGMQ